MITHYVEHAIVVALGAMLGAAFAVIIAPGDTLLLVGTGIVFGFCARALFDQNFGGEWRWPLGRPGARKTLGRKTIIGHR
jgi:hypothetical protein